MLNVQSKVYDLYRVLNKVVLNLLNNFYLPTCLENLFQI